ncbi:MULTISPECIES: sulfurtransferase TusA family protein [unclassified Psychrobacter]|uniref:sulfurtransferase TusA family protein n=1 Tax=unclassified Psychrobacter TaxID=196806 RepID=UPI0025E9BB5E|nr:MULTISPECIES: sulfurtransferase TusA family protein [unclassified Psychrobacter]
MSASNQSVIESGSYPIRFAETLSESQQQTITQLLDLLSAGSFNLTDDFNLNDNVNWKKPIIIIKNMVDGRGLACPMPLLKTKVALRDVTVGESLYVVATDPNSQADISAFCQQSQQTEAINPLLLVVNQTTASGSESGSSTHSKKVVDTIYHFIITKTDSN